MNIHAQPSFDDFQNESDITIKSQLGVELWNHYLRNSLDTLKMTAIELILASNENDNEFGAAVGRRSLGSYLIRNGQIEKGLVHLKEAKNYFDKKGDYTLLSESWNEIGNAYRLSGKYKDAIGAYQHSLESGKLSSDSTARFSGEYGLGNVYLEMGDTSAAIQFINHYKNESIKKLKYEASADACAILGMIAMDRGNISLSKEYYRKSIFFSSKSNSQAHLSHAYNNKAILHFNIGELDSCLYYFNLALELRKKIKHTKGVIESYFNIGSYYLELGEWEKAAFNFRTSAELAKRNHFNVDELDALEMIATIYNDNAKLEEAQFVNARMDSLKSIIDNESALNDDILHYAESSFQKKVTKKESSNNKKNGVKTWVWLIPIAILVVLLAIFGLKKRKV